MGHARILDAVDARTKQGAAVIQCLPYAGRRRARSERIDIEDVRVQKVASRTSLPADNTVNSCGHTGGAWTRRARFARPPPGRKEYHDDQAIRETRPTEPDRERPARRRACLAASRVKRLRKHEEERAAHSRCRTTVSAMQKTRTAP